MSTTETRVRFEDLSAAVESRGAFDLDLGDDVIVHADPLSVLVFKDKSKALVLLACLPKELVDAEPPTPGVLIVLRFLPEEDGCVGAAEVLYDGEDYELAVDHYEQVYGPLDKEADPEKSPEAQELVDLDHVSEWRKPGFFARLCNAWDALRGRRPWG